MLTSCVSAFCTFLAAYRARINGLLTSHRTQTAQISFPVVFAAHSPERRCIVNYSTCHPVFCLVHLLHHLHGFAYLTLSFFFFNKNVSNVQTYVTKSSPITIYTRNREIHCVSKKLCQHILCSVSVKYKSISIKIDRRVLG